MNKPLELAGYDVYLCDHAKEVNLENMPIVIDAFFLAGTRGCKYFYSICHAMNQGIIYKILSSQYNPNYSMETLYKTANVLQTKFYLLNKHKYNIKLLNGVFTTDQYISEKPKDDYAGIHMQYNSWLKKEHRRYKENKIQIETK